MKAASVRVAEALRALGIEPEIVEFAQSTRTAEEAALAIGTSVGQIVKSLLFTAAGEPLLVLVSGCNRASLPQLTEAVGAPIERADAATVRRHRIRDRWGAAGGPCDRCPGADGRGPARLCGGVRGRWHPK